MWPFRSKRNAEDWIRLGEEALAQARHEEALQCGEELLALRHTFGFELKARALTALGRSSEARRVLEESVRLAPGVPVLWSLLGESCSNAGDHPAAHEAFARLEALGGPHRDTAIANDAWVLRREGRFEEALRRLDVVGEPDDPGLRAFVARCRVVCLVDLERFEDAIRVGEELLARWPASLPTADDDKALILFALAQSYGRRPDGRSQELAHARKAVVASPCPEYLARIREIENLDASRARLLRLTCVGELGAASMESRRGAEPATAAGYFRTYWVLAESAEEALSFARPFEDLEFGERLLALEADRAEVVDESVKGGRGVCRVLRGRTYFSAGAEDSEVNE